MAAQRRVTICREGWYYLAVMAILFAGALARDINVMMLLFGMMAGPYLYNWWNVSRGLRNFSVRRKAPARIEAGESCEIEYEALNARRRFASWAVRVEDLALRGGDDQPAARPRVVFARVPPGAKRRLSYRLRLQRCGRYQLGPLSVATRFPLGLVQAADEAAGTTSLVVYPRLGRLTNRWRTLEHGVHQSSAQTERRQGLTEGDFHSLRNWRSGDSRRWIHWRTSARRGELMVKQFEQPRNHDLALVLDLWQPTAFDHEHRRRIELAQSFAATIVADLCQRGGSQLLLAIAGQQPDVVRGAASSALLDELLDTLAVAEATSEDRLPELLTQAVDRVRPGTTVMLVGTRPVDLSDTERFADLWSVSRRHAVLSRTIAIDTGSASLSDYFQLDPDETTRAD